MKKEDYLSYSYEKIRMSYPEYLCTTSGLSKLTIQKAYSDTFYLWREASKEVFWDIVFSSNFEIEAKEALRKALSAKSTGNVERNVNGYLSHLRRFRKYLGGDIVITTENNGQGRQQANG